MLRPRLAHGIAVIVLLVACDAGNGPTATADPSRPASAVISAAATPTPLPPVHPFVPSACSVTHPAAPDPSPPIGERALPPITEFARGGQFLFGNESLWVYLPADGVLQLRQGQSDVKFGWWRLGGGDVTISGRRLDGDAPPLGSYVPAGYGGTGFQAASLVFPTPGCWEVSGHADGTLTFVVYVRGPQEAQIVSAPPGSIPCRTADEVVALLDRFINAVNAGRSDSVAAATSASAQWFSLTTPERHEVAHGRERIAEHLARRHAAGDRYSTPRIEITSLVGWDGSAHFAVLSIELTRDGQTRTLHGKGALQCGGTPQGVVVLSLGS